MNKLDNKK